MYIPKHYLATDKEEIIAFMKRFSFATIITAKDDLPLATHLPFLVRLKEDTLVLAAHFAKANDHWKDMEQQKVLVIFSEPHAYISPKNYDSALNVPTWNYLSVHAYGHGKILMETAATFKILEATIDNYEIAYRQQWDNLPKAYKQKMAKGIVAFEITVTELQAKKKLSQNKTGAEQQRIINSLSQSNDSTERILADYMAKNSKPDK